MKTFLLTESSHETSTDPLEHIRSCEHRRWACLPLMLPFSDITLKISDSGHEEAQQLGTLLREKESDGPSYKT